MLWFLLSKLWWLLSKLCIFCASFAVCSVSFGFQSASLCWLKIRVSYSKRRWLHSEFCCSLSTFFCKLSKLCCLLSKIFSLPSKFRRLLFAALCFCCCFWKCMFSSKKSRDPFLGFSTSDLHPMSASIRAADSRHVRRRAATAWETLDGQCRASGTRPVIVMLKTQGQPNDRAIVGREVGVAWTETLSYVRRRFVVSKLDTCATAKPANDAG